MTTSGADAIHYLLIGHLAKDLLPGGSRLGGTVAYAALTARSLGYTPGLVTAHADDLDLGPLADFPRVQIPSTSSTTFENIYTPQGRTQFVRAQAAPLTAFHLPEGWRRAPIVHLAPLARELDSGLVADFAGKFVGLTPQGWMRTWDAEGRVSRTDWPEALDVLPHASATVVSLEDVSGDWAVAERWARATKTLVVTEGPRGCTVFTRGEAPRTFSAPKQPEVDPTGAGDVFATSFFINFYETEDPWASAKFANQVAALSVTRPGLDGVPDPEEIGACRVKAALSQ